MTRVAMYPASVRAKDNPFITILVDGLRKAGVEVAPFTPFFGSGEMDALHVHWLEQVCWGKLAKRFPPFASWFARRLIRAAERYRARGKRVVWTVHNLRPHDSMPHWQQRVFQKLRRSFLPLVSDVVLMTDAITDLVSFEYPEVASARKHVLPHPHFRDFFAATGALDDVRAQYGVDQATPMLAVVGMLRRYKGIPSLVLEARRLTSPFAMIIAGDGDPVSCQEIVAAIDGDNRFIFVRRRMSHRQVASILAQADAALFNFEDVLNSGSVMASLSLSTPVICPRSEALIALEKELGSEWVHCFRKPLDVSDLSCAVDALAKRRESECPLDRYDPAAVGRLHRRVYETGACT